MLRLVKLSSLALALVALVFACQPRTDFPEVGGDYNTAEVVSGSWRLQSLVQNDEGAISKGFPDKAKFLNLSDLYTTVNTLRVNFSTGADSSFSATMSDTTDKQVVFLPIGTGYRWRFIDPTDGPRYIQVFKRDAATGLITETYRVDFGQPRRVADNRLTLRFARRNADGVAFVSYDYNLVR